VPAQFAAILFRISDQGLTIREGGLPAQPISGQILMGNCPICEFIGEKYLILFSVWDGNSVRTPKNI
jgi:hypothetical protein